MKFRITDVDPDVQFGPKPKDVFIKLPFKGQQSNMLKRQLTRLFARLAPWTKINFISMLQTKLGNFQN